MTCQERALNVDFYFEYPLKYLIVLATQCNIIITVSRSMSHCWV